jgi:hypothetical protein
MGKNFKEAGFITQKWDRGLTDLFDLVNQTAV